MGIEIKICNQYISYICNSYIQCKVIIDIYYNAIFQANLAYNLGDLNFLGFITLVSYNGAKNDNSVTDNLLYF